MQEAHYKRCKKCELDKPVGEYYRHKRSPDGLEYRCKACSRQASREWNRKNPERHKENLLRWTAANVERKRELRRQSYKRHSAPYIERAKAQKEHEPEKYRARYTLTNAVREGRIAKPSNCEDCGAALLKRRIHGHHPDYSKPLDVEWLCARCHATRHAN